ncbi:MAG: anion-transporting ATPase [Sorangium cellulosum]|nr:MAG: anion-transporting ATPase [Sorangium cellulosum]
MNVSKAIEGRKFLFLTGKGGVGKTTVVAALALVLASQGKRVLCAMCQAKDRLSTLLEGPSVGEEIVDLRPNIQAVNIQPEAALREHGMMVLRVKSLYKAVFDNNLVNAFFRATPGLYEWAMLGKAWFHATEVLPNGKPRYDVVLFDAPSTGHALDMLRGPKVIVDVAPAGLLRQEAVEAWSMFSDPTKSGVVLVTLPEEMPVTETFDLLHALDSELKLPIAQVIVNGVIPPLFSPTEREALLAPRELKENLPGDEALASGARRAKREWVQHKALVRLRDGINVPLAYLPHRFEGVNTFDGVSELAMRLT